MAEDRKSVVMEFSSFCNSQNEAQHTFLGVMAFAMPAIQ
jgi:hypothetical protein